MQTSKTHGNPTDAQRNLKQSLQQGFSAALLVFDEQGKLGYANVRAGDLIGVDPRLVVGLDLGSLFRLEAFGRDLLTPDGISDLYRREVRDETFDDCVVVRLDGQRIPAACEVAAISDGAFFIVLRPVETASERGSLSYRASHDILTGLPNRTCTEERLENLHRSAVDQRHVYSILFLDLDHFKAVNDRFGHATGDQVLAQVGRRIAGKVRGFDTLGRWGGEEFLCLLPDVNRPLAEEIAERIRAGLEAEPVECQGRHVRVTSSIGVATYPDDGLDPDALLARADAALYEAKRSGRNRIQSVTRQAGNVFALAHVIEQSLREERVRPAYQSVINLVSGKVCGAEALARIQLDDRRIMDAAYFIPAAEQLHLVHQIDHKIIQSASMRCTAQRPGEDELSAMFVNVSADFLRHPDLVEDVLEAIMQHRASSGGQAETIKSLVIEITERQFMDDTDEAKKALQPFLDLGLRIAIDDFGVGYSSLNYLIALPVSFIKLEGSLVRRVTRERRVRAVLQGIQELAVDLGVITVAEGIEDEETVQSLREMGVDWGQGYHFSRPTFQF